MSQFTEEQVQALPDNTTENTEKTENDVEAADAKVEVHSIGCGPSPDREVEAIFTREVSVENSNDGKFQLANDDKIATTSMPSSNATKVSIGTSPLPPECSTQVSCSPTFHKLHLPEN